MHQELKGRNGKIFGSTDYIQALNEDTFIAKLMDNTRIYKYRHTLDGLGDRLDKYVDVIYEDLRLNSRKLRFINDFTRRDFAKFLERLEELDKYLNANTDVRYCIELIELYDRSTDKFSDASDNKIYESVKLVQDGNGVSVNKYEREKILDDLRMGYRFDSDDEDKKEFVEKLMNGETDDFIKDVHIWYNFEDNNYSLDGKCGRMIAGKDYMEYMMNEIFGFTQDYNFDYVINITESFEYIKDTVERDLVDPKSYYISTSECEKKMYLLMYELADVGVNISNINRQLDEIQNYDELYDVRVMELQGYLRDYGFYNGYNDGMLSPDTLEAIDKFLEYLENTDMRKLTAIEVIDNTIDAGGEIAGIVETALENSPELEKIIKDFEINGKTYKIDAKTFKAVGDTATILSIILEVTQDITDDGMLGRRSLTEVLSQGGSILGGKAGYKLAVHIGKLAGTGVAFCIPGLSLKAGKALGGITVFALTVAGSMLGSVIGRGLSNIGNNNITDEVLDISPN